MQIAAGQLLGTARLRGGSKSVNKEQFVLRPDDRFRREMSFLERSIFSGIGPTFNSRLISGGLSADGAAQALEGAAECRNNPPNGRASTPAQLRLAREEGGCNRS